MTLAPLSSFTSATQPPITARKNQDVEGLAIHELSIDRPDGTRLIEPFSVHLKAGDRLMISGPSGCGKSSILRAAHGLWPWGSGTIETAAAARKLIIAQKPHLPLTTLKGIVSFPDFSSRHSDEAVAAALEKAGLGNLTPHMNDGTKDGSYWERLSGGEKQRISFARALLLKPDILMLDEVTASLDIKAQDELYQAVLETLPQAIIVSISHRMELERYHNRHASIENRYFLLKPQGDAKPRETVKCPVCAHPHPVCPR
ncbi:MAG: ATP-binding cassette domain-containing protein [Micavibrio aeruginosavorus]|uniref:ATP-binding cassette domain-containing protein n=1 Tax=Micavibrio aeruginosavorus TaxID=349221 RepID=A0A7T5UIA5_9BACT|nr:MAG: ATP-binding cassette domain-containing protein [Micavibrio aeruginosavorus]